MRIIFMGTPEFALPCLEGLFQSGQAPIAVVTQPDRPSGRGQILSPPPIKVRAQKAGLPVLQPGKMKDPSFLEELRRLKPDVIVTAAFGRILPPEVLKIPRLGCINVHASLLPKYRGAAPIQWAIIQGEKRTGVTTFRMDEGMDTGDIYLQEEIDIDPSDTAGTLSARLSEAGAKILLRTLSGLNGGSLKPIPQEDTNATQAPLLTKEQGEVDWSLSAEEIVRFVRGLDPWPGAYTFYRDERWRLWNVAIQESAPMEKPGTIVKAGKDGLEVATGLGLLVIRELQPASGRRMAVREYLSGHLVEEGVVLGE
jgi:methionyl-tRNA formyltransferase